MPIYLRHRCALAVACLILAGYVAWIFAPGVHGTFLFDDWANLPALTAQGSLSHPDNLIRYLTSGRGDPTGRPVSMLAFAFNASDWPANPAAFKWFNIGLHAMNAGLLILILHQLCGLLGLSPGRALCAATVAAFAWAIHPLFASTVLYAVQREAILAGTFILLGMLCWLFARAKLLRGEKGGLAWLVLGVGTCTVLATLSKANGILLPLLVLVTDATLPTPATADGKLYRRRLIQVLSPFAALVLGALVLSGIASIGEGVLPYRGWSVGQRLLTEPAILWDYVWQLLLLKPVSSSVFHDQYVAARHALDPWYVLPAIAAWVALVAFAWRYRHRYPAASAAVLFFVAGHLLESSSISLELYFEHRNYVPAMMAFLPLGVALGRTTRMTLAVMVAVIVACGMSVLARVEASRWSDTLGQADAWAALQPGSPRAQAYAAQVEALNHRNDQAVRRLDAAMQRFPDEPQIAFNVLDAACRTGEASPSAREAVLTSLRLSPRDPGALLLQWTDTTLDVATNHGCPGLDLDYVSSVLDAAMSNPAISAVPGRRQDVFHLRGEVALAGAQADLALAWFNRALEQAPTPQAALGQAAELGSRGRPDLGIRHLDAFASMHEAPGPGWTSGMPWVHARILRAQNYWPMEIAHLRKALTDASHKTGNAEN